MKASPDTCHLLLSKNENFEANFTENRMSNTRFEKLLGVIFDSQSLMAIFPKFAK